MRCLFRMILFVMTYLLLLSSESLLANNLNLPFIWISDLKEDETLQARLLQVGNPDQPNYQVTDLILQRVRVNASDISLIGRIFPKLECLQFYNSEGGDAVLEQVSTLDSLKRLVLGELNLITDAGMALISKCSHLKRLGFWRHPRVTEEGIRALLDAKQLEELTLGEVDDKVIEIVAEMNSIKELAIISEEVTDAIMPHIGAMVKLNYLYLHGKKITDEGIRFISQIHNLAYLNLADTSITDEALRYLQGLHFLKELEVSRTKVGDLGLSYLANHPTIKELILSDTKITDAGVKFLTTLPKLRALWINFNPAITKSPLITDNAVEYLIKIPALNFLVTQGSGISHEGDLRIREAKPGISISW